MSFKTASAILRGRWLIDKQWANAHMPLVYSFIKGEAGAAKLLMGDEEDSNISPEQSQNLGKNVYSVYPSTKLSSLPEGAIAFIDIDGPLLKGGDWCSYGMEDYAELMYGIMTSRNIAGAIIDIDSPGGQADGTATFADAIKRCTTVKPVIGFIDDGIAASAAYWAVSACSEIYCSQSTDAVGSVGVYCSIADWNAYYASQGLPIKDVYAPESTDKNLDYRESLQGNDELVKNELSVIAQAFIGAVKTNRKGKIKGSDWTTGKMFFPAEAQSIGLIDGIKSFDQIVMRINKLISSNSTNNTMAFQKTLAAAKANEFAVTDEGFVLSEEMLNNIEAALVAEPAENPLLQQHTETIATQATRITELEGQVAELTEGASGNGTVIEVEGDPKTGTGVTKVRSALSKADHPLNIAVKKMVEAAKGKKK